MTIYAIRGLRDFVLVGVDEIHAKLQIMAADDFGHVIAKGDGRIGVQRAFGNVAGIFRK